MKSSKRTPRLGVITLGCLIAATLATFAGRGLAQADAGWIDLKGHYGKIWSLVFSPDGKQLVSISGHGSEVRVWDIAAETSRVLIKGGHSVAAFMADGKSVACGTLIYDEKRNQISVVALWDIATGKMGPTVPGKLVQISPTGTAVVQTKDGYAICDLKANRQTVAFNTSEGSDTLLIAPDGKTVAAYAKNAVRLFDVAGGKERVGIAGLVGNIKTDGIAFSPDSTRLVCTTDQTRVTLWDVSDPAKRPRILADQQLSLNNGLSFSPDGTVIAARGTNLSKLELVDARTLKPRTQVTGSTPAQFTGAGTLIASPTRDDGQVVVADATGKTLAVVPTGDKRLDSYRAVTSPDGSQLAFGLSNAEIIRVVKLPVPGAATSIAGKGSSPQKKAELMHPKVGTAWTLFKVTPGTATLTFSPDGKYLIGSVAASHLAGNYAVWDVATGRGAAYGNTNGGWTFLPDGKTLYTQELVNHRDFVLRKTDLSNGRKQTTRLPAGTDLGKLPFGLLALSPDQKAVAGVAQVRGGNKIVFLPNADFRKPVEIETVKGSDPRRIAYSPDGKLFAIDDGLRVRLFDVTEKAERPTNAQYPDIFLGFVDGGKALGTVGAKGGERDHVRVFDIESGQMLKEIDARQGHSADVTAAALSPVGHTYATCDADGTVLLKDWETGKEVARFKAHNAKIVAVAFSPDGKTLATGTEGQEDGFVRLWVLGGAK